MSTPPVVHMPTSHFVDPLLFVDGVFSKGNRYPKVPAATMPILLMGSLQKRMAVFGTGEFAGSRFRFSAISRIFGSFRTLGRLQFSDRRFFLLRRSCCLDVGSGPGFRHGVKQADCSSGFGFRRSQDSSLQGLRLQSGSSASMISSITSPSGLNVQFFNSFRG